MLVLTLLSWGGSFRRHVYPSNYAIRVQGWVMNSKSNVMGF